MAAVDVAATGVATMDEMPVDEAAMDNAAVGLAVSDERERRQETCHDTCFVNVSRGCNGG